VALADDSREIRERDERAVAWLYGSVLTAPAVAVAADIKALDAAQVFSYTAATMTVIWLAHAFSEFVGHGGRVDLPKLGGRVWHAMRTELPVLVSACPTLIALAACWLLGATVETAGNVGLAVSVTVLVLVAAGAAQRSGAAPLAIAETAATALVLGGLIVVAKISLG
jgi:hypothetical protein